VKQPIVGYHRDEEKDWVAELQCGHNQHIRHNPPWMLRPWVTTLLGRESRVGKQLDCKKCDRNEPQDFAIVCLK